MASSIVNEDRFDALKGSQVAGDFGFASGLLKLLGRNKHPDKWLIRMVSDSRERNKTAEGDASE